jgi:alpha-tubulin suppressor-like RCC1 family protein
VGAFTSVSSSFGSTIEGALQMLAVSTSRRMVGECLRPRLPVALAVAMALVALSADAPSASAEAGTAALTWGENFKTQLGAGYKDDWEAAPVSVLDLTNITAVAAAYNFNLALVSGGAVWAWGGNDYGQLGDGTREDAVLPTQVINLGEATAVSAAGTHSLALLSNKTVMAWGSNEYGELGNGELNPNERTNKKGEKEKTMVGSGTAEPKLVPELTGVVAIASGGGSNYALLEDGALMAWGRNDVGQLGIGEKGPEICKTSVGEIRCSTKPRAVDLAGLPEGVKVVAVSAGVESAYALLSDHEARAWGNNSSGELGDGSTTDSLVPVEVLDLEGDTGNLTDVNEVSGGSGFALALLEGGRVAAWGSNNHGQLGTPSSEECGKGECATKPILDGTLENTTAVSAGEFGFGLAASATSVFSFGRNSPWGLLGIGNPSSPEECGTEGSAGHEEPLWCSRVPLTIKGLGPVSRIGAGEQSNIVVLRSGEGPPPLLSLTPEVGALLVTWTFDAAEYRLRWKPLSSKKFSKTVKSKQVCGPEAPCSYHISGVSGPQEVVISSYGSKGKFETKRAIIGEPLTGANAPSVIARPSIKVTGSARVGGTLTENAARWTHGPTTFSYQWLLCSESGEECSAIKKATKKTYVVVSGDLHHELRVEETASNSTASTTTTSGLIEIVSEEEPEEPPVSATGK